jgi:hypothetical protein
MQNRARIMSRLRRRTGRNAKSMCSRRVKSREQEETEAEGAANWAAVAATEAEESPKREEEGGKRGVWSG